MFRSHTVRLRDFGIIASLAILSLPMPASAQYTWIGGSGTFWSTGANWTPTGPPNSATATATFSNPPSGTVTIGVSTLTQSVSFSNPTGNYNLTSGAGQTLSGLTSITVDAAVTGVQTINLANISTGSLLFPSGGSLTITNNSPAAGTTLVIGPNTVIGAPSGGGVIVGGAGTTQISGSFAASPFTVNGGLVMNGPGTLILSHVNNSYTGGTFVLGGTLQLGAGTAIPTGGYVAIYSGAEFNIGSLGNSIATAIGELRSFGGTFRVPSGSSDYHLNQLTMTGGTVDFSGTAAFVLHLRNAGAAITTNGSLTTATWLGSVNSHIQNDSGSPLNITVAAGAANGIDLDAGIALSQNGGQGFVKSGPGTMKLTNTGNTADITVSQGSLRIEDMATNGVGALGTGTITLNGGTLAYGGATATTTKNLLFSGAANIQVLTPGANLNYNGAISESVPSALNVYGPGTGNLSSTLTLAGTNSYSFGTSVGGNAILAIPTISNSFQPSPIGTDTSNTGLNLGNGFFRGTLLLTGTNPTYSSNRKVYLFGQYANGGGGAIGIQNFATNLTLSGQINGETLIKTGLGTLTLNNNTNNYTGGTYVEAGTLYIGAAGAVIPANSDVTVSSNAALDFNGDNFGHAIHAVTLIGGTLNLHGPSAGFYLNRLVAAPTGGAVDFVGANATGLFLTGIGAGATINGNTNWTAAGSAVVANQSGAPADLAIAPTVALSSNVPMSGAFRVLGGGTVYLTTPTNNGLSTYTVSQGRLRVDDLSVVANGSVLGNVAPGLLTLDGGTLQYTGSTFSTPMPITLGPAGGTVEVSNAVTTLTASGTFSGFGLLTKTGPGVLMLNNPANNYAAGIAVSGGRLDVSDDAQLGSAAITVNPFGTLRYTANATTARSFTLNSGTIEVPIGLTLTLNGAQIGGGFLRGAGAFALTGGTALSGVSTATSTTINQTGPASVTNFTNNGQFTNVAGQMLTWSNGTNTSSGRLTVNGTVNATDFISNGLLTIAPGGVLNHTGSNMVLGGGSTTFVGSVANPGGKIDLGGQQLIVRGGLLVTNAGSFGSGNGVRNGTTVADYGALVKGTGPYQAVITQNGGQYLPGNSPGTSQVGDFFINGGGNLIFEITDAGPSASFPSAPGVAGTNPGWGLTQVFTSMNFTATPSNKFNIDMRTQLAPPAAPNSPGLMSSFDPTRAYSWKVFDLQPGAVFNGTFDANAINFITTQFANPSAGGMFSLSRTGGQIFLTFTPVPEPAVILGAAFAGLFGWWGLQRRRRPEPRTV